jgi:hypothetical protein
MEGRWRLDLELRVVRCALNPLRKRQSGFAYAFGGLSGRTYCSYCTVQQTTRPPHYYCGVICVVL